MLIVDGESTWNTVKVFRAESIDHIGEGIFKILLGVSLDLTGDLRKNIGHVVKPDRKKLAESKSPECQADDRRLGNPHYKKVFRCAAVGLSIPCCLYFTFVSGTSKPSTVRVKVSPSIL